jgi:hypothetical protein
MARTLASIKRRHYKVMYRPPGAYTRPTTAALFTTFLGTFMDLGYCRDKTIKLELTSAEKEALDTGAELGLGFNGHLEFDLLQTQQTDIEGYEALEGVSKDYFFYSEISQMCIFIPTAIMSFKESVVSGEVESVHAEWNATNLATKLAFRDRFAQPLT